MAEIEHSYWMRKAIDLAEKGNSPFGAVIVNQDEEYISAFNTSKADGPTAHAEINVIKKLSQLNFSDSKNLTLITTVESCPMCMGAIIWAEIGTVCFGCSISDAVKYTRQIHIDSNQMAKRAWYEPNIISGVMKEECLKLFTT